MAYKIIIYPEVSTAMRALPTEARTGLADAFTVLTIVPWNGEPYKADNPEGNMRQIVFGPGGAGIATYLILEDQQRVDLLRVDLLRITWLD